MIRSRLPTNRGDWYRTAALVGTIITHPGYMALSIVAGLSNVVVFVAARNAQLVRDVVLFGSQSPSTRLSVFVNLLPIVGDGLEPTSETILLAFGTLAGLTFAAVVFRLRRESVTGAAGTGAIGVLLGTAGVGCATCGIPLLVVVTGTVGASAIATLPFGGNEFVVPGTALLVLSLFWLANNGENACSVDGLE